MEGASQLVFVDTPGIFAPMRRLERAMVAAAWEGADDADLVILLVDASARPRPEPGAIVDRRRGLRRPRLLFPNKTNAVNPPGCLDRAGKLTGAGPFPGPLRRQGVWRGKAVTAV